MDDTTKGKKDEDDASSDSSDAPSVQHFNVSVSIIILYRNCWCKCTQFYNFCSLCLRRHFVSTKVPKLQTACKSNSTCYIPKHLRLPIMSLCAYVGSGWHSYGPLSTELSHLCNPGVSPPSWGSAWCWWREYCPLYWSPWASYLRQWWTHAEVTLVGCSVGPWVQWQENNSVNWLELLYSALSRIVQ